MQGLEKRSNGIKEGNWKLTLNTVPFEECCKIIGTHAFKSGRVNNYNDPLMDQQLHMQLTYHFPLN